MLGKILFGDGKEMIDNFEGEFAFLSNFYPVRIICADGFVYPTAEHAYQAHKSTWSSIRNHIASLPTPGQAKREGAKLSQRANWEVIRVHIMHKIVFEKFHQNRILVPSLLATGNIILREGNNWHDNFWGVCSCEMCKGGLNMLGKILMLVRDTFKEEEK